MCRTGDISFTSAIPTAIAGRCSNSPIAANFQPDTGLVAGCVEKRERCCSLGSKDLRGTIEWEYCSAIPLGSILFCRKEPNVNLISPLTTSPACNTLPEETTVIDYLVS